MRRKTNWSMSKKETKLVALRDKNIKKCRANSFSGTKTGPKFSEFFLSC